MEKSLEMRVWLKVNFSVLREIECKMTLCDRNVLE